MHKISPFILSSKRWGSIRWKCLGRLGLNTSKNQILQLLVSFFILTLLSTLQFWSLLSTFDFYLNIIKIKNWSTKRKMSATAPVFVFVFFLLSVKKKFKTGVVATIFFWCSSSPNATGKKKKKPFSTTLEVWLKWSRDGMRLWEIPCSSHEGDNKKEKKNLPIKKTILTWKFDGFGSSMFSTCLETITLNVESTTLH